MPKLSRVKKEELIHRMQDFKATGITGNDSTFKRMSKCERYRVGKQWDPKVLEFNKSKRKFSLTINRILPIVNQLSGFEANNPKDITSKNLKGGTAKGAEILSQLIKHALDLNHAQAGMNRAFEDGVGAARGFLEADVDYSDDPIHGDIVIRKLDPFMVVPDPACKSYDFNDPSNGAKYILVEEWRDKGEIELKYPGKKTELSDIAYTSSHRRSGGMFSSLVSKLFGGKKAAAFETTYRERELDSNQQEVDYEENNYRISRFYWKEWEKGAILRKPGERKTMTLITDKDITFARKLIEQYPGTGELIEKDKNGEPILVCVLHKTVMAGDVLLSYKKDPFNGMNNFPIVRFSPYFVNGYEFGVVDNLLDIQDQVNWSWSMELNIIRQLANTGWKINRDITGMVKSFLRDHGGEDGIVLDEHDAGGKIEKLEPTPFPTNYDVITERGSRHISEVSQVRLEEPNSNKNESGKAVIARQNWSINNISNISSNWEHTLRLLGDVVLGIIMTTGVYSEEEIREIVDENDLLDPDTLKEAQQMVMAKLEEGGVPSMQPPEQPSELLIQTLSPTIQAGYLASMEQEAKEFQTYMDEINKLAVPIAEAMLLDEISNLRFGKYSSKTELSPHAETYRMQKMVEIFELNRALIESGQPGVSRRLLIDATDVKNKDEITAEVPQVQGVA